MAGHAFPFYRRAMAGRGVAAAAGVFLVVLPVEMAIAAMMSSAAHRPILTLIASTTRLNPSNPDTKSLPLPAAIPSQRN